MTVFKNQNVSKVIAISLLDMLVDDQNNTEIRGEIFVKTSFLHMFNQFQMGKWL
ncbi:hypothetical protein CI610_03775 [invertebrate metagenome]|uniref:Uncharacterized protein n=1 Tax=invertebrate metagenome TaxID=1711999 RepID=A0A2H9T272_9ZZZZ